MFFLGTILPMPVHEMTIQTSTSIQKGKSNQDILNIDGIIPIPDTGVHSDASETRGCFGVRALEWSLGKLFALRLSQTVFDGLPVLPRPDFHFLKWHWSGFMVLSFSNYATLDSD